MIKKAINMEQGNWEIDGIDPSNMGDLGNKHVVLPSNMAIYGWYMRYGTAKTLDGEVSQSMEGWIRCEDDMI